MSKTPWFNLIDETVLARAGVAANPFGGSEYDNATRSLVTAKRPPPPNELPPRDPNRKGGARFRPDPRYAQMLKAQGYDDAYIKAAME